MQEDNRNAKSVDVNLITGFNELMIALGGLDTAHFFRFPTGKSGCSRNDGRSNWKEEMKLDVALNAVFLRRRQT